MKRKLLYLVLVTVLAVAAYLYFRPVQPVLSVESVYNVTEIGEFVPVNITLSNVPGCSSWNMRLTWDPYYLRPVGVQEGPFLLSRNSTTFFKTTSLDYENGEMIIAEIFLAPSTYVQGTGVILTVNFTTVRIGASTIELGSPANGTQAAISDAQNQYLIDHVEVYGLISNEGPPPTWASTDFQSTIIVGEVALLSLASGVVYLLAQPRLAKAVRRKQDFRPAVDPEDQA